MGYYSNFSFNRLEGPEDKYNALLKDVDDLLNSRDDAASCESFCAKWYSCESDMRSFAAKYPNLTVQLDVSGEESDDLWRLFISNGKSHVFRAQLPDFGDVKYRFAEDTSAFTWDLKNRLKLPGGLVRYHEIADITYIELGQVLLVGLRGDKRSEVTGWISEMIRADKKAEDLISGLVAWACKHKDVMPAACRLGDENTRLLFEYDEPSGAVVVRVK